MTSAKDKTLREWTDNGPHWIRFSETIHQMLTPVTRALIEEADIRAGQEVLDVAGGAGEPALTIAEVVGPTGSVTCTDAVKTMLDAAQQRAALRGISNVTFRQCDGESLPFPENTFDSVVSRLGIMFFDEPSNSLREMLRVVRPGGHVSVVVWNKSELNPFCNVITRVLESYVETRPADKDAPGAFRFAEEGKLAKLFEAAGGVEVKERKLDFQLAAPLSFEDFWELRSYTSSTLREKLAGLASETVSEITTKVKDLSRDFFTPGSMSFPATMLIVSSRKR